MFEYGKLKLPGKDGGFVNCLKQGDLLPISSESIGGNVVANILIEKNLAKHAGRNGCSDPHCCRQMVGLIPGEAILIIKMYPLLDKARILELAELERALPRSLPDCIFLKEGKCQIYPLRPLMCAYYWLPADFAQSACKPTNEKVPCLAAPEIYFATAKLKRKAFDFALHPRLFYYGLASALAFHMGWLPHPIYEFADTKKYERTFRSIDGGKTWTR